MDIDEVFKQNKSLLGPDELERHMAREECLRAFWDSLPSSLLWDRSKTRPWRGNEQVYPIFCLNCGCPQGHVTREAVENGVVCICRNCAATYGGLPLPEVPDELIRPSRRA